MPPEKVSTLQKNSQPLPRKSQPPPKKKISHHPPTPPENFSTPPPKKKISQPLPKCLNPLSKIFQPPPPKKKFSPPPENFSTPMKISKPTRENLNPNIIMFTIYTMINNHS